MIKLSAIKLRPPRAASARHVPVALLVALLVSLFASFPGPAFGVERPASPSTDSDGILLNFQDAPLSAVLDFLSETAGFVIVSDSSIQGRVSVVSRQPVSPDEAVKLLDTLLRERGYAAILMGRILKIVPLTAVKQETLPVRYGNDPDAIVPSDRIITQVIPLRFVDAAKLKDNLAALLPSYADISANASSNALILTDSEADIRRVIEIVKALDAHMSAVTAVKVFPLTYASASNVAKLINEVFKQETSAQQQQGPMGDFRRFMPPGAQPGASSASNTEESGRSTKVTASADERTNTVVVSGPPDVLAVVERVVHELEANPASEQAIFVYRLRNATAANLETELNKLFTSKSTSTSQTTAAAAPGRAMPGFEGPAQSSSSTSSQSATDLVGQVYTVADTDSNSLMVMTASKNFQRVRDIIAELDKPVPEVVIKVLIAEVTHTDTTDLGVEFSMLDLRQSLGSSTLSSDFSVAAQSGGMVFKLAKPNIEATLRALEESGKLEVLSRPYILASDNQEAKITVGNEVPFITNSRTTDTGQTINTIEYQDIGIILTVTPHINSEGLVTLDIAPEVSALTGDTVPISETVSAPVFAKRSASSRVAIRDGQTIVIGGLMDDRKTDTVRKVPLLGNLPLVGAFFRRSIKERTKTELLIFLTPHVVQQAEDLGAMSKTEMFSSQLVPEAIEKGAFQKHLDAMQRESMSGKQTDSQLVR
jgi:general secretion pathway protein D